MTKALAIPALLVALAACSNSSQPALDHGWAPPGACEFVGNRADRHFCATTSVQLLANPSVYDGHLVRVSGWVVAPREGRHSALFLTRDALDGSQSYGSVNLDGPMATQVAEFAQRANSTFAPVNVSVSGTFRLYGLDSDGSKAKQGANRSFRFGSIEVSEWSP